MSTSNELKNIVEPSPEAIDFAKRMIALKWTRETDVDTIASCYQAGYVRAQVDTKLSLRQENAIKDNGWVDVKDGLPGEGERVFVYYENSYGKKWRDVAFYTYGGVREFDDDGDDFPECYSEFNGVSFLPEGFWFNSEVDESLFQRINVTHWQLLPQPPKPNPKP